MSKIERDDPAEPPIAAVGGDRESFGAWLRSQRLGRAIELRTIADASKISLRYLEALEQDRFEILPALVFAKGFLRQYARFVGLDPEEVVTFFLEAREAAAREAAQDAALRFDAGGGKARRRAPGGTDGVLGESPRAAPSRRPTWAFLTTVVLTVGGLVGLVGWLSGIGDRESELAAAPAAEKPPGAAAAAPADRTAETVDPPEGEPAVAAEQLPADGAAAEEFPAGGAPAPSSPAPSNGALSNGALPNAARAPAAPLNVILDFTGDCWVEATIDGGPTGSGMRVQGESMQLEALREVELKLGNAAVVEIEINGRPYPLVATGSVQRIRLDLETVRSLRE